MKYQLLLLGLSLVDSIDAYVAVIAKSIMSKTVDPIKFPGSYNNSHLHIFHGSDKITAHTKTSAELRQGCTSANNPCDFSAYWIPSLVVKKTSKEIKPFVMAAYYMNIGFADIPIPENLKMIAGNSSAQTLEGADPDHAGLRWFCHHDSNGDVFFPDFPSHSCGHSFLHFLLYFPDCVDPNNISKTAYSDGGLHARPGPCPHGMKRIPQLRFSVRYHTGDLVPSRDLILSSGNIYSSHGDFFMGWDPETAKDMLSPKARGQIYQRLPARYRPTCHRHRNHCKPHDREPNHGLSYYGAAEIGSDDTD